MSELHEEIVHGDRVHTDSCDRSGVVLASLEEVMLPIEIRIGSAELTLRELLDCRPGAVVKLDSPVGANVHMLVNGKSVASGELVAVDGQLGVRITDVVGEHC